jgi:hypothetical protein
MINVRIEKPLATVLANIAVSAPIILYRNKIMNAPIIFHVVAQVYRDLIDNRTLGPSRA